MASYSNTIYRYAYSSNRHDYMWCVARFGIICTKSKTLLKVTLFHGCFSRFLALRKKCPNTEFFLIRIQENTDKKKLRIWTLFTQCKLYKWYQIAKSISYVLRLWCLQNKGVYHFLGPTNHKRAIIHKT